MCRKRFHRALLAGHRLGAAHIFLFFSIFALIFLWLAAPLSVLASEAFPAPVGYVNDFASMFDESSVRSMESLITELKDKTGAEIAVVTVESLGGLAIEDYASGLFEEWKIGQKGEDNGVLLLVAKSERKVRIEVGYGLEPVITDSVAGRILDQELIPSFKEGEYGEGAYRAVYAIASRIAKSYGIELGRAAHVSGRKARSSPVSSDLTCVIAFAAIFLPVAAGVVARVVLSRRCPRCKRFRLRIKSVVLEEATESRAGKVLVVRDCFACGFHGEQIKKIPRISRSTSWGAGGTWGSSGRSSWGSSGGFGGFGGGSSGGGGASRGW